MSWYFYAIFGVTLNALSHVLRKKFLAGKHKLNVYESSYLFSFSVTIALGIYALLGNFIMPPIETFLLVFLVNIAAGLIAWITNNKGLSLIPVGEYSIIMTTRLIVTWFASLLFLGIGLNAVQALGSLIIAVGIFITFYAKNIFAKHSKAGVMFTLITAFIYGMAIITDQIIYRQSDPASFLLIGFALNTLLLLAIKPKIYKKTPLLWSPDWGIFLIGFGVVSTIALVMVFTSLKIADNAPLVTAVFQMQTILAVIFGIVLLGERKRMFNKIMGSVVATIGAVLIVIS